MLLAHHRQRLAFTCAAAFTTLCQVCPLRAHATTFYVSTCGDNAHSGLTADCGSPSGPKLTIQAAINAASTGDTILVAPGVYNEMVTYTGTNLTLVSAEGPKATILDGAGLPGRIVTINALNIDTAFKLQGFTLRQGYSDVGGGLYAFGAHLDIIDCLFWNNSAFDGAAINLEQCVSLLSNCTFLENASVPSPYEHAVALFGNSNVLLQHCVFHANSANSIVRAPGTNLSLDACRFMDNIEAHATIKIVVATCTAVNSLFHGNNAASFEDQGAFSFNAVNCTFTANQRTLLGGDVNWAFTNCIMWNDAPGEITGAAVTVSHCDIKGGWTGPGSGNIDADPLFLSPGIADLRLHPDSPCIDAGNSQAATARIIERDFMGADRLADHPDVANSGVSFMHLAVDIGAFEFQPDSPILTCSQDIAPLTGDGVVNVDDLISLIAAWGPCPN